LSEAHLRSPRAFWSIIIVILVLVDQAIKVIVNHTLDRVYEWNLLGVFGRFERAENTGAFLSFGAEFSASARMYFFIILVGLFLLWVAYQIYFKVHDRVILGCYALLLAGGLGNLYDRMFRGYVIDYVVVGVGPLRTGIFNFADFLILLSLLLIFAHEFRGRRRITP
jgi:signal peptidase II